MTVRTAADGPQTIEFTTFIYEPGVVEMAYADTFAPELREALAKCAHRYGIHTGTIRGQLYEGARCAFIEKRTGLEVGLESALCAKCQANGGPERADNPWLAQHAKGVIYVSLVPGPETPKAEFVVDDSRLEAAVAAAKTLAGAAAASDLLTTAVVSGTVTPERAVDLHLKTGLLVEEPIEEPIEAAGKVNV